MINLGIASLFRQKCMTPILQMKTERLISEEEEEDEEEERDDNDENKK